MTTAKARELRKNLTDAERTLWSHLRLRQMGGYKFRRQQRIDPYIVDFACLEKRVVIEVDGGQHAERKKYDCKRDVWLRSQGFQVLRFWNNQVLLEIDAVNEVIMSALNDSPHLSLPRKGGRKCSG